MIKKLYQIIDRECCDCEAECDCDDSDRDNIRTEEQFKKYLSRSHFSEPIEVAVYEYKEKAFFKTSVTLTKTKTKKEKRR